MKTEALTITKNLLAEILIMCAAQRDSKNIDHDLIFKLNELLIQITPILEEVGHNKLNLEAPGFMRYRSELERVFKGHLHSIDSLLPERQVTTAELTPGGPDGFKINHDYSATDAQQFLHDVFFYIESVIDKEFSDPGIDIDLQVLDTINEKLLLLKYTGIYEFLETSCGNKKKTAAIIAAIIGEKPDSVRVISTHLETPHIRNRLSPYTPKAVANVLRILRQHEFNIDKLELIYNSILRDPKN